MPNLFEAMTDAILGQFAGETKATRSDLKKLYKISGPNWLRLCQACELINRGYEIDYVEDQMTTGKLSKGGHMAKKESNPGPPEGAKKPPAPPAPPKGPPNRTFHSIGWGMLETKESKRATENYEHYIKGYTEGRVKEESNPGPLPETVKPPPPKRIISEDIRFVCPFNKKAKP